MRRQEAARSMFPVSSIVAKVHENSCQKLTCNKSQSQGLRCLCGEGCWTWRRSGKQRSARGTAHRCQSCWRPRYRTAWPTRGNGAPGWRRPSVRTAVRRWKSGTWLLQREERLVHMKGVVLGHLWLTGSEAGPGDDLWDSLHSECVLCDLFWFTTDW